MQCTGLKDKNDKLIFEGDILKNNVNNLIQYVIYNQPQCEFSLKHTDEETRERKSFWLGSLWKSDIKNLGYEIIGNIYEHPELIEEESCNNCEKSGLCHCSKMDEDNVGCVAGRCGEYKRAVKE